MAHMHCHAEQSLVCCSPSELRECATALHEFHVRASRRQQREQTAIHEKYSQHKYHAVATCLAPPPDLPLCIYEEEAATSMDL